MFGRSPHTRAEGRRACRLVMSGDPPSPLLPLDLPGPPHSTLWNLKDVTQKPHNFMISMVPFGALILWASNSHPRCKRLSLSTIDILGCIILHCGAILCIVGGLTATLPSNHCMPAVSLVVMTKNVTIHYHMSPGGQNSLPAPWEPQY